MDYISVIGIAFGLAMDAFAVSVTNGALTKNLKLSFALKIAFFFGIFQLGMPVIGWLVGKAGQGIIQNADHWVAFVLLAFIGGKMILDFIKEQKESEKSQPMRDAIGTKTIVLLAVATSIDALATGIILPSAVGADNVINMVIAVVIIGIITFVISLAGIYLGKAFGNMLSDKATLIGGIVLVLIGVKILCDHLIGS